MVSFEEHEVKREERTEDHSQEVGVGVPVAVGVNVDFISVNIRAALQTHGHAVRWLQFSETGDVTRASADVKILITGGDEEVSVCAKLGASTEEGGSVDDGEWGLSAVSSVVNDDFRRAAVADLLFEFEVTSVKAGLGGENGNFVVARVVAREAAQAFWAANAFASRSEHKHWRVIHRFTLTGVDDLHVRGMKRAATKSSHAF